ncbi:hypothetical protein FHS20_000765 [Phyllobacterium endophyticum]|nr:hypothetical protein [Phyllobacterium endophyticum]
MIHLRCNIQSAWLDAKSRFGDVCYEAATHPAKKYGLNFNGLKENSASEVNGGIHVR